MSMLGAQRRPKLCEMLDPIPSCLGASIVPSRTLGGVPALLLAVFVGCGGRESGTPAPSGKEAGPGVTSGSSLGTAGASTGSATSGSASAGGAESAVEDAGGEGDSGSSTGGSSGSATSSGSDAGECTESAVQCDGLVTQVCAGGQWEPFGDACLYACSDGGCTGACTPASIRCSANAVQTCGSDGQWNSGVACPAAAPFCDQGQCTATAPTPEPPSCQTAGNGLSKGR